LKIDNFTNKFEIGDRVVLNQKFFEWDALAQTQSLLKEPKFSECRIVPIHSDEFKYLFIGSLGTVLGYTEDTYGFYLVSVNFDPNQIMFLTENLLNKFPEEPIY